MSNSKPVANQVLVDIEMNLTGERAGDPSDTSQPVSGSTLSSTASIASTSSSASNNITKISSNGPTSNLSTPDHSVTIEQIFSDQSASTASKYNTDVDETIKLAATLVKDAKSNRFLDFKHDRDSLRLYILYYNPIFKYIQYLMILIILGLATLEKPALWPDTLPFWAPCIIEIVALGYLGFRIIHLSSFQHQTTFWQDKKNIVAIILIVLSVLDIISYSIWAGIDESSNPIRWSRPLRPLFIINFPHARQIRRAFRNIRRTILEIVFVLILFLLSVMLFALLALKIFGKKNLHDRFGKPYFKTYPDALWRLYVLVTTANNPDVMMPAYDVSHWYSLFFIIFLIVTLYVFMNVLLAVIFNSYKRHLKNEVKQAVFAKRRKLASAYDLVKTKNKEGEGYHITLTTWTKIMKELFPKKSKEQVTMLFQVMDGNGDGVITKAEFLTCADLLNVPLTEVKDRMLLWNRMCPRLYNSKVTEFIRKVVKHKFFRYFFDLAIVVNAVFIAVEVPVAEWFFLALFTLEIILKLYAYGARKFASQFWNMFDVVVIGGAIIATMVEAIDHLKDLEGQTLDIILVIRVLRLVKLVNGFDRFRIVITTLVNIGPSIIIYGGVLFTFYYSFAIVGMEIFQNRIRFFGNDTYTLENLSENQYYCGNIALKDSEFWIDRYCSNNFNNIGQALVVLSELTVVNQWHVLTSGFVLVTHPAAKIYFLLFHLTVVVLIMNIFIAFILEAFILEYSLSKSKFESQFEAKILQLGYALGQKKKGEEQKKGTDKEVIIDDMETEIRPEEGTRFHVKQSRKKVEVLLMRMFENELDPEDLGMTDQLNHDIDRPSRKYTLDSLVS